MFESLLPAITLVSLGLLGPASVAAMVLARGRHASASVGLDRTGRAAIAAALVASAGGVAAWLLGGGLAATATAAVALAAPVVVWAYLAPWWPVRAVVAWTMLVTGSVGAVGMATAIALDSPAPWTALPVAAVSSAIVTLVFSRLSVRFRQWLGIRAGIRRAVQTPLLLRPALLRPTLALGVFVAAMATGGLTGVAPRPGGSGLEAGSSLRPGDGDGVSAIDGSDVLPVSAETAGQSAPYGLAGFGPVSGGPTGFGAGSGSLSPSGTSTASSGVGTSSSVADPSGSTGGSTTYGTSGASPSSGSTASLGSGVGGSALDGTGGSSDAPVNEVSKGVESTTETVQKTTDPVVSEGGKTAEPVTSTVEKTTEPVTSTVEKTTEPVTSTVEKTTEPVTSTVEKTTEPVTSTLEKTTEPVVSGTTGTVNEVSGSVGSVLP